VGGTDVTLIAANLKEDEQFKRADETYFRTLLYGVLKEEDTLNARVTPLLDARSPNSRPSSAASC